MSKILDKFENVEELEKAYQELEKKLSSGKKYSDMSFAEQMASQAELFGEELGKESSLSGKLKETAQNIVKRSNLPTKQVDEIVSAMATQFKESRLKENREAVSKWESEGDNKANLQRALEKGGEMSEQFKKRIAEGSVTPMELNLFSAAGKEAVESAKGVDVDNEKAKLSAEEELFALIEDPQGAWLHKNHPKHEVTLKRKQELEKIVYGE